MSTPKFDKSVGENIQSLRKSQGMSQAELADKLTRTAGAPFHQQTVLRIEKGERPLKLSEAMSLARIFGIPPTALWRVSEVDVLTGNWLQRVEDLEHRQDAARAEFEAIRTDYMAAAQLASAFLHLQEYLEGGAAEPLPESLEEIAAAADRITESTPARDRFKLNEVLKEIGVTDDEIQSAAKESITRSAVSIVRHIIEHHDFETRPTEDL